MAVYALPRLSLARPHLIVLIFLALRLVLWENFGPLGISGVTSTQGGHGLIKWLNRLIQGSYTPELSNEPSFQQNALGCIRYNKGISGFGMTLVPKLFGLCNRARKTSYDQARQPLGYRSQSCYYNPHSVLVTLVC